MHANMSAESVLWTRTHFRGKIIPFISVCVRPLAQGPFCSGTGSGSTLGLDGRVDLVAAAGFPRRRLAFGPGVREQQAGPSRVRVSGRRAQLPGSPLPALGGGLGRQLLWPAGHWDPSPRSRNSHSLVRPALPDKSFPCSSGDLHRGSSKGLAGSSQDSVLGWALVYPALV